MGHVLELEPGSIEGHRYDRDSVEGTLYDEFASHCRAELGQMLVQPTFSADEVPAHFVSAINRLSPAAVLLEILDEEKQWISESFKPVTRKVGELATLGVISQPEDIVIDPIFVEDMERQIESLPYDFSELQRYRDIWAETSALDLMAEINQLREGAKTDPDWLDKAFVAVESATHNPETFTIPLDHPEALYLVTFLPWQARALTRRLIVGNHIVGQLKLALGNSITEAETEMLGALKTYHDTDALVGQHWDDLAKNYKLSEATSVKMAHLSIEEWDALATLQSHVDRGTGQHFFEVWKQVIDSLHDTIAATAQASEVSEWQSIDTGHGFDGFIYHDLLYAARHFGISDREFAPEKLGLKAVVFEDDDSQKQAWKRMIKDHSPYLAPEELSSADPEVVTNHVMNPEVGLFLLDIQNGDDLTAGIRLAETIFRQRLDYAASPEGQTEPLPHTRIIVWSSSVEAVNLASDHFDAIFQSLPSDVQRLYGFHVRGHGRGQSRDRDNPIYVDVRDKRWHTYTDMG